MPRKARFFLPDIPTHVVQRGNNRSDIFFEECDYHSYLEWLMAGAEKYQCNIYAYVLMTNHVHILVSSKEKDGISRLMQYVGRFYVPYINKSYGRTGTLWEGRFKCNLVQDEYYLINCMRYIEYNPVRAGIVKNIRDYPWSSYQFNAFGKDNRLISTHERYIALDIDPIKRRKAYRSLFKTHLSDDELGKIRAAWQTGTPLGNENFLNKLESELDRKLGYMCRGRPIKGL